MMRALDPEVSDAVFAAIEGLLPVPPPHPLGCHRPRVPDRVVFRGFLTRLVTGAAWTTIEFLLDHQVSDTTLRTRRDEWIRAGVFDQLVTEARHARCDPLMVPDTGQGGQQAACSKEDMQRWEDDPGSLRRRSAMPCWRC